MSTIITNVKLSLIEAFEDQLAEQDALDALHAKRALHPKGKVRGADRLEKHYRDADVKLNHVSWTRAAMGKPMSTLDEGLLDA